jgi:hypothetical protein
MTRYLGIISDKFGNSAFNENDSNIPGIQKVENISLENKKFDLVWIGTKQLAVPLKDKSGKKLKNERGYNKTQDVYELFEEFTTAKPQKLFAKNMYALRGYTENSAGNYEYNPNRGFVETEKFKNQKLNKPVKKVLNSKPVEVTKNTVGAGLSLTWTLFCAGIVLFFVFPQCFT